MNCTYSLQLACQRTEISSRLAVLVQNGLQVVYWPEFKRSGSFVLWTKYLIIKLLRYFFLLKLIRRKIRKKKKPTLPHENSPRAYNLSHVPQSSFITAVLRHQCSSHKHSLKSVVLLRQSAAHNQLFIFAPSITHFILKKKKHLLFSGIYKYLPQFFLLITKSVTKAYSTLFTNSIQIHKGVIAWHTVTASVVTQSCGQLFSFSSHIKIWSCRGLEDSVINSLWVDVSAERV